VGFTREVMDHVEEIVAVDTGSTDGTVDFLNDKGVRVVQLQNPDMGNAIKAALDNSEGDYLLFFCPDGSCDPNDIPILFEKIDQEFDTVIASRYLKGSKSIDCHSKIPWQSWLNKSLTWLANYMFADDNKITDSTTNFRVIKREKLKKLNPDEETSSIWYQMTIRSLKLHHKTAEIPTVERCITYQDMIPVLVRQKINNLKIFFTEIVNGYSFEK
jgi:glycosyltransferase involved in cell wall biosynthesis